MRDFLNKIRMPVSIPISKKIIFSVLVFLTGVVLGVVSKMLDETAINLLPPFLEMLDLGNFFSRMGFWLFSGVYIAIFSKTSICAALNSFLFFVGMVGSYYATTVLIAGFNPRAYMMIWIFITLLSPFLGAVCWYAKGTHIISICISAVIFMLMTRQAFAFGFWYLDVRHALELLLWGLTFAVLFKTPKQIILVATIGILLFFLTAQIHLFWGML
jgi:hypothetical protein